MTAAAVAALGFAAIIGLGYILATVYDGIRSLWEECARKF